VTLYRRVHWFTPLLIDAARPARHLASDRWFVDETYVKVSGSGVTSSVRWTNTGR
jgi:transposase-like protein